MILVPVWSSVTLTVYSLIIPFCWLVGGGDQERTKEVELTVGTTSSSGGALGAEKKTIIFDVKCNSTVCMLLVSIKPNESN